MQCNQQKTSNKLCDISFSFLLCRSSTKPLFADTNFEDVNKWLELSSPSKAISKAHTFYDTLLSLKTNIGRLGNVDLPFHRSHFHSLLRWKCVRTVLQRFFFMNLKRNWMRRFQVCCLTREGKSFEGNSFAEMNKLSKGNPFVMGDGESFRGTNSE
jgi:hypothetical protein